ncbi:MerR family transcriptional regulator [Paenibacillus sp. MDMC362]|uniref:MerR family transcriptional regulator n=1 Tax=Paenibacillus sp. MDMC362 TaxID=2977365 RepID=UPI001C65CFE2|nr:MerR family transcriptional regulator [Paenibacillus sp. MDMC362]
MFTIGEISKLFQIDIRTLRYYDDIDLFKPATVDHLTNYRYYSVDQFEQLNTILYLKALGIPESGRKSRAELSRSKMPRIRKSSTKFGKSSFPRE